MDLATKWAYYPLFAETLTKFANKILLHSEKTPCFETQYFSWGGKGGVTTCSPDSIIYFLNFVSYSNCTIIVRCATIPCLIL